MRYVTQGQLKRALVALVLVALTLTAGLATAGSVAARTVKPSPNHIQVRFQAVGNSGVSGIADLRQARSGGQRSTSSPSA